MGLDPVVGGCTKSGFALCMVVLLADGFRLHFFSGDIMSVGLPEMNYASYVFGGYLADLRNYVCGDPGRWSSDYIVGLCDRLNEPAWRVRGMYRAASYSLDMSNDPDTDLALHHVRSCLGHNVMNVVRHNARLSALHALVRVGGRWREGEDMISSDHLAMYMYSRKVLGGRLPREMHNRIVMESYVEVTSPMRLYLEACTKSWVA